MIASVVVRYDARVQSSPLSPLENDGVLNDEKPLPDCRLPDLRNLMDPRGDTSITRGLPTEKIETAYATSLFCDEEIDARSSSSSSNKVSSKSCSHGVGGASTESIGERSSSEEMYNS